MNEVIIIHGNSGHGKDTLADVFALRVQARGLTSHRANFADKIKETMSKMTGCPRSVAFGDQRTRAEWSYQGLSAREWQQEIGTWGRSVSPNFWLRRWYDTVRTSPADVVICSDGRMPNERIEPQQALLGRVTHILIRRKDIPILHHETELKVSLTHPNDYHFYYENNRGTSRMRFFSDATLDTLGFPPAPRD